MTPLPRKMGRSRQMDNQGQGEQVRVSFRYRANAKGGVDNREAKVWAMIPFPSTFDGETT